MEFKWWSGRLWTNLLVSVALAAAMAAADRGVRPAVAVGEAVEAEEIGLSHYMLKVVNFLWRSDESSYQHVWPVKELHFEVF